MDHVDGYPGDLPYGPSQPMHDEQSTVIVNGDVYKADEIVDARCTMIKGTDEGYFSNKPVMLKIFPEQLRVVADNESAKLRYLLSYDNSKQYVVEILDYTDDALYHNPKCAVMVMKRHKYDLHEYARSCSLQKLNECVVPIMRKIMACLLFLHDTASVIHGNLTLENVVCFHDDSLDFKLRGFENARNMNDLVTLDCCPEYCPPEVAAEILAHGKQPTHATSLRASGSFDVWSFGVLWMKFMLQGKSPVEFRTMATEPEEILKRVCVDGFNFDRTLQQLKIPASIKDFIRACTSWDPQHRLAVRNALGEGTEYPLAMGLALDWSDLPTQQAAPVIDPSPKPSHSTPTSGQFFPSDEQMKSILRVIRDGDPASVRSAEEQLFELVLRDRDDDGEAESIKRWLVEQDDAIPTLLSKWPDQMIIRLLRLLCHHKRTCYMLLTKEMVLKKMMGFVDDGKDKEAAIDCLRVICSHDFPELNTQSNQQTINQLLQHAGGLQLGELKSRRHHLESITLNGQTYTQRAEQRVSGRNDLYVFEGKFNRSLLIKKYRPKRQLKGMNELQKLKHLRRYQTTSEYVVEIIDYSKHAYSSVNGKCSVLVMEHGQQNLMQMMTTRRGRETSKSESTEGWDNNVAFVTAAMKQVANCLLFLHSAHLVHGDLRLQNVVNFGAATSKLKLVDFENCRKMGQALAMDCRPEYCPPELACQLLQGKDIWLPASGSFDVWCFGVLWMKCLLNGTELEEYKRMNSREILEQVCQPDFGFEKTLQVLSVSTAIKDLIRGCTRRDPTSRPSMDDILRNPVLGGSDATGWSTTTSLKQKVNTSGDMQETLSNTSEDQRQAPGIMRSSSFTEFHEIRVNKYDYVRQSAKRMDGRNELYEAKGKGKFDKLVMIKIYLHEKASSAEQPTMKETSSNEAKKIEELMRNNESKQYIVEPIDFSSDVQYGTQKCSVLVMKLGKKNLKEVIERLGRKVLTDHMVMTMKQIAENLRFLHCRANMVHGDLKLENVVNFGDDRWDFKLIDFENCCRIGSPMSMECTPEYCPPELANLVVHRENDKQPALLAAGSYDVWCFGVLWMKYLRGGKVLTEFEAKLDGIGQGQSMDLYAVLERITDDNFNFNETLQTLKISNAMKDLIGRCTKLEPTERPTFCEILFALTSPFGGAMERYGCDCRFCKTLTDSTIAA